MCDSLKVSGFYLLCHALVSNPLSYCPECAHSVCVCALVPAVLAHPAAQPQRRRRGRRLTYDLSFNLAQLSRSYIILRVTQEGSCVLSRAELIKKPLYLFVRLFVCFVNDVNVVFQ